MEDALVRGRFGDEVVTPLIPIVAFGGGLGHDSACGGVFFLEGHEVDGHLEFLGERDAFGLATDDQVAAAAR